MSLEVVSYAGWERCVCLRSGSLCAYVTLEVGPRVIGLEYDGSPNLFHVKESTAGQSGGDEYRGYGGHRLWTAPEILEITCTPDNDPVRVEEVGEGAIFTTSSSPVGLEKSIEIQPVPMGFILIHRVRNVGTTIHEIAPWALSVMRTGGEVWVPMPAYRSHGAESLLPVAPLVLWSYTNLGDGRYHFDDQAVRLKQLEQGPTKFGMFVEQGLAVAFLDGLAFATTFDAENGAAYPDMGCNFESFTRHDMLEVETLGPMVTLKPGDLATHTIGWHVRPGGASQETFSAILADLRGIS